jgi:hypothetical protein
VDDLNAILVAARDEEERIAETVRALRRAFPDAAVIVADDGSRDATAEQAEAAGALVLRLRRRGKGQALSDAERAAPPGALLLVDADLRGDIAPLLPPRGLRVAAFAERRGGGFGIAKRTARALIRIRSGFDPREPLSGQRSLSAEARAAVFPLAPGFGAETRMTIDAVLAGHAVDELELPLEHRATGRDARGFLHRGRQLVDAVFAAGPLRVNYRGARLPLVGWTVALHEPLVTAIGLADDRWSGEERGFAAHLRSRRTTGVLKLVGIPLRVRANAQRLGRAARGALGECAEPTRHEARPRAEGVHRGRARPRRAARARRPARSIRSPRDDDARRRRCERSGCDARVEFRESFHGTRPVARDRRPRRPHHHR